MPPAADDQLIQSDEAYFEAGEHPPRGFDAALLREPATVLPARRPIVLGPERSVTEAVRAMQAEHRGAVLVTEDGTMATRVRGIFTERDVLLRIVDGGRNPALLPLGDVMTVAPECLRDDQSIAQLLHCMSVGGFRHVPVVDAEGRPVSMVSVRDVVELLVDAFPRDVLNRPSRPDADRVRAREGG